MLDYGMQARPLVCTHVRPTDPAQRIINILSDDELSRRPLDPPGEEYGIIWRLDDVLFETLKVLAE